MCPQNRSDVNSAGTSTHSLETKVRTSELSVQDMEYGLGLTQLLGNSLSHGKLSMGYGKEFRMAR